MLNNKEKLILQYLYQQRKEYSSSQVLADYLSYSDRTIRTYIKKMVSELDPDISGFEIVSKQGYGYQLVIHDKEKYNSFLAANNLNIGTDYGDIETRHQLILNKLVFEGETILFDDLADQLFVSRSTLSSDFKKIREKLAVYRLSIDSKPYHGAYVSGQEQDKRHFIMDYFFSNQFHYDMNQFVNEKLLDLPIPLEELTIIVLDECRNYNLHLSDYVIQNLVIHLGLAIQRFKKGLAIAPVTLDRDQYQKELAVAKCITDRLSKQLGDRQVIPDEEVAYIALHLITKNASNQIESYYKMTLRQEVMNALLAIESDSGNHFSDDFSFMEGLLTHLEVLLERVRNNIHMDNPLLDDIKSQFPEIFSLTQAFISRLKMFRSYTLSEDELAYVSLHFLAAIERAKEKHKLTVLVICATGYGSAQMLKNRISNELGQYVTIADVIGYYDLDKSKLEGVDMIMSTIDLSTLVFTIPVLTVSVFFTDEEVEKAKKLLGRMTPSGEKQALVVKDNQLDSQFDQYFEPGLFRIYDSGDKAAVLKQMISDFKSKGLVAGDEFEQLIERREELSTVVFNQDIAVPHPLKPISEKHAVAVAIVRDGLYWEKGFEHIRLIFMVSPSIYTNEGLARITNRIVDIVDHPEWIEALVQCHTFDQFKKIFLTY
ncbi:BglG family transcription antiterminator [Streptococcus pluranimalium]